MALFQRLKRFVFGLHLDHPVFGNLAYESHTRWKDFTSHEKLPGKYTQWVGFPVFPPTGKRIQVFLPGDEAGPADEQVACYQHLIERWSKLFDSISPQLYDVYRKWFPDSAEARDENIDHMKRTIQLWWVHIENPKHDPISQPDHDLSLDFTLENNDHFLGTDIRNWIPIRVQFR